MSAIVRRDKLLFAVLRETEQWGIRALDLARPPGRFWSDKAPPAFEPGVDGNRIIVQATPAELLCQLPKNETWSALSRRSLARLHAHFLICEDPQRRLDAREVVTLAHQVSLVRHVLEDPALDRVMIADEVGLGKTVEAGLIIKELLSARPGLRVLYLAPARLVSNVGREFDRLGLCFSQWKASNPAAQLSDPRVIASIHRAVHGAHFETMAAMDPWDIIVIDECHHLTAWSPDGGNAVRKYRLARQLVARQENESRLLLLSGTPHQGHPHCFDNLLALLRRPGEAPESVRGRVIYRTKEDVTDWNGQPIFPLRQVNEPLVVELGAAYRDWLTRIHHFYEPPEDESRERAAGWRCAQALQWAASSPQAGLGYLARQAMRAKWTLADPALGDALAALRPYRNGAPDEPVEELFTRIQVEIERQRDEADIEDMEEDDGGALFEKQKPVLAALLAQGLEILREPFDPKWEMLRRAILDEAGNDKIVLFAQPIETVMALAGRVELELGERPAIIMGGQTDLEREKEVERFCAPDGPRLLISSKAGGEGINLQVARRLVHLDVPWNPMDMEQRVGRVHRFGSRRTILVDTLVVKESRESDAYRVARERLRLIASTLVSPERFEALFSRVMCLVPPENLQALLIEGVTVPLTGEDQARISEMVETGFKTWSEFHGKFSINQQIIRAQEKGLASWEDLRDFLVLNAGAVVETGFHAGRFKFSNGEPQPVEEAVEVIRFGKPYLVGDYEGALICSISGEPAFALGLNLPAVAAALRLAAMPSAPVGAAQFFASADFPDPQARGVLVFLRQTLELIPESGWIEHRAVMHWFSITEEGKAIPISRTSHGDWFRALLSADVPPEPVAEETWLSTLLAEETRLLEELREGSRENLCYAVTPLFAAAFCTYAPFSA